MTRATREAQEDRAGLSFSPCLTGSIAISSHYPEEETEEQGNSMTCSRSHSSEGLSRLQVTGVFAAPTSGVPALARPFLPHWGPKLPARDPSPSPSWLPALPDTHGGDRLLPWEPRQQSPVPSCHLRLLHPLLLPKGSSLGTKNACFPCTPFLTGFYPLLSPSMGGVCPLQSLSLGSKTLSVLPGEGSSD